MNYWLLKSEPDTFSIDDLATAPKQTTSWDGVRNYQARNMLRDSIKKGDLAFFYHSTCAIPGIAGIARISKEGYPDKTQDKPRADQPVSSLWFAVDVTLVVKFKRLITLDELRKHQTGALKDLVVLRKGNRLSVTPVTPKNWDFILTLE